MIGAQKFREAYEKFRALESLQGNIEPFHGTGGGFIYKVADPCPGTDCSFEGSFNYDLFKPEEPQGFAFDFASQKPISHELIRKVYRCLSQRIGFNPPIFFNYGAKGPENIAELNHILSLHSAKLDDLVRHCYWSFDKDRVYQYRIDILDKDEKIMDDDTPKDRTSFRVGSETFFIDTRMGEAKQIFGKNCTETKIKDGYLLSTDSKKHDLAVKLVEIIMGAVHGLEITYKGEYVLQNTQLNPDLVKEVEDFLPPPKFIERVIMKEMEKSDKEIANPNECRIDVGKILSLNFRTKSQNLNPFFDLAEDIYEVVK